LAESAAKSFNKGGAGRGEKFRGRKAAEIEKIQSGNRNQAVRDTSFKGARARKCPRQRRTQRYQKLQSVMIKAARGLSSRKGGRGGVKRSTYHEKKTKTQKEKKDL